MVVVGLTVQNKRGRNCQHTPLAGVSSAVSLTMTRVKVARIASLKSRLKHASSISCEHHLLADKLCCRSLKSVDT